MHRNTTALNWFGVLDPIEPPPIPEAHLTQGTMNVKRTPAMSVRVSTRPASFKQSAVLGEIAYCRCDPTSGSIQQRQARQVEAWHPYSCQEAQVGGSARSGVFPTQAPVYPDGNITKATLHQPQGPTSLYLKFQSWFFFVKADHQRKNATVLLSGGHGSCHERPPRAGSLNGEHHWYLIFAG